MRSIITCCTILSTCFFFICTAPFSSGYSLPITHQVEQTDSITDQSLTAAKKAYSDGKYDHAMRICRLALTRKNIEPAFFFDFRMLQCMIKVAKNDLDSAIYFLGDGVKVLETSNPKFILAYSYLAVYHARLAKYETAIEHVRLALKYNQRSSENFHEMEAMNLNTLGLIYRNLSYNDSATYYLKKSLEIRKEAGDSVGIADCYNNLGLIKYTQGYLNSSLEYHARALAIREQHVGNDHITTAYSYNNIGLIYLEKEAYDSAEFYILKSLQVKQSLPGNHLSLSTAFLNLGLIKGGKEEYESAKQYFKKSIASGQANFSRWHPQVANAYSNLADLFMKQSKVDSAGMYYDTTLLILNRVFDEDREKIASVLRRKSQMLLKKGDFSGALKCTERGIKANTLSGKIASNNILMMELLSIKAEIYYNIYKESQEKKHLFKSLELYRNCNNYINEGRKLLSNRKDRVRLSGFSKEVASEVLEILIQEREVLEEEFESMVWDAIEKSKINDLQLAFSDENDRLLAHLPEALSSYEKTLHDSIAKLKSKLQLNEDKQKEVQSKLFDYTRNLDSLMQVYQIGFPKYYQIKYGHAPLPMSEVQETLSDNAVLINYFLRNKEGYVMVLTRTASFIYKLDWYESSSAIISDLYQALAGRSSEYIGHAHDLYYILFKPLEEIIPKNTQRLIISPDGILSKVPFELLSSSPCSRDYLIKRFEISYNHSTSILNTVPDKVSVYNESLVAYAPVYEGNVMLSGNTSSDRGLHIAPLLWNQKEAYQVQEIFGGRVYLEYEATEEQFKKDAKHTEILHLSMHAQLNDTEPLLSKLLFSHGGDEDGSLHAFELLNMDIKANMAVLSGCRTADGLIEDGEGVIGIGYAFTAAGVPSTVMSQWSVDDKSTALLMKYFYENLSLGMRKSQALRQAKLKFINEEGPIYAHPFYWGAFILYGDDTPLKNTSNANYIVFYLLIAAIAAFVLGRFLFKKW